MKNKIVVFGFLLLAGCQSPEEVKLDQYKVEGMLAYQKHCENCHQTDGKGLANLYPPLANSDFLKDKNKVICLIKNGIAGEIVVNGKTYNQPMPANTNLQELDIALITTYIYTQWGNENSITSIPTVREVLKDCK